jgi:hypothetical protein
MSTRQLGLRRIVMQRRKLLISAIAIALGASSAAHAQVTVDVAKMTCGQFATYKIANPKSIAIWLNGYHHGVRGDAVVDTQQLDTDTKKIQDYCISHSDAPLMQAVETILGPSK